MSEEVPRRANFRGVGKAWILEEVSVKKEDWEPIIQYLKFDDPDRDKALRFGYYVLENGRRIRLAKSVFLEIGVLNELKGQISQEKAFAIKQALKELCE
jgi:stage III sporulation protein SpoIIIAA